MDVVLMTKDAAVALHGPIAVSSVNGKLTAPLVQRLSDVCADHRAQYRGREISLTLTREGMLLPDAEARKLMNEMSAGPEVASVVVVVIDSTGFWAAAARGVIASLSLVTKAVPKATKTVAEALAFLAPYLKNDPDCQDIAALEKQLVAFRDQHLRFEG